MSLKVTANEGTFRIPDGNEYLKRITMNDRELRIKDAALRTHHQTPHRAVGFKLSSEFRVIRLH